MATKAPMTEDEHLPYQIQINTGSEGWRQIAGWGGVTLAEARLHLQRALRIWDAARIVGPQGIVR